MAKPQKKEVLVTRFSAIGDVAMAAVTVCQAAESNPEYHFTMLTKKGLEPFFELHKPQNLTVIGVDLKKYDGIKGFFRLLKSGSLTYRPNIYVDLHNVLRTKILRVFFSLKLSSVHHINKNRKAKKELCKKVGKKLRPLRSTIEEQANTFTKAGLKINLKPITRKKLDSPYFNQTSLGQPSIGIAPFARHQSKIYPIEQMEQVVATLLTQPNRTIYIFGGGHAEEAIANKWQSSYPNVVSLIGKLTFLEELKLISNLKCMVSMDSASMHLASLVGTPVVSIWGGTHPYAGFMGYGQLPTNAIGAQLSCRPCSVYGNKPCYKKSYECMHTIQPSQVVDLANKIISE